jgi:general secretion pathway protein A
MYESFYGFKEKPFDLHPDPDYLYMSRVHETAYVHLGYAITENKGFTVVTGEIGSGKTTLLNYLLNKIGDDIKVALVNNTNISPPEFLRMICQEFELDPETNDKSELIDIFSRFLIDQFAAGERVVLIIDEAQNLTNDTMEEIRMLSNIETQKRHLIQIILVGQPELKLKLKQRNLKQVSQRITVHCHLQGLEKDEVNDYITHRLEVGGGDRLNIFDNKTIEKIALYSRGIPRLINILCDSALVYGYADGRTKINTFILDNVYEELKSLGIFMDFDAKPSERFTSPKPIVRASVPSNGHLQDLEAKVELLKTKVQLLEAKVQPLDKELRDINGKLDFFAKKRTERDDVVIQLIKLLQENLESRTKLLKSLTKTP